MAFFGCDALIDLIWPGFQELPSWKTQREATLRDIFAKVCIVVAGVSLYLLLSFNMFFLFLFLNLSDRNDCADYVTLSIDLCAQRLPSGVDQILHVVVVVVNAFLLAI